MIAFYSRTEFARHTTTTVLDAGDNAVQVTSTLNGRTTTDRLHRFASIVERDAYLAELDRRMADAGHIKN